MAVLVTLVHGETPEPRDVPPAICDVAVEADPDTRDVTITWSGGTPPFVVVRADAERLRDGTRVDVVAEGVDSRRFVDRRAFRPDERLYYQVYDSNSPPDVFDFSPDGGLPGAEITVRGVVFRSDCDQITVYMGGVEAPLKFACSFTGFVFRVPPRAVTGSIVVATPGGVGSAGVENELYCNGQVQTARSWP